MQQKEPYIAEKMQIVIANVRNWIRKKIAPRLLFHIMRVATPGPLL